MMEMATKNNRNDHTPETTTVNISGAELHVTPITELPHPESITAGIISSRILTKQSRAGEEGAIGMDEDMYQLLELCVEDGIQRSTIESLDAYELNTLVNAVFPDPDSNTDTDTRES